MKATKRRLIKKPKQTTVAVTAVVAAVEDAARDVLPRTKIANQKMQML